MSAGLRVAIRRVTMPKPIGSSVTVAVKQLSSTEPAKTTQATAAQPSASPGYSASDEFTQSTSAKGTVKDLINAFNRGVSQGVKKETQRQLARFG
ncbi:MAG: hypothetical protein JNK82_23580 [Myxococcaceae bacterium]|nr:hypothetical protein [Myxococcaceae bacterium]